MMPTSTRCAAIGAALVLACIARPAGAQFPSSPDSMQKMMGFAIANAARAMHPADAVLELKDELRLTNDQIGLLTDIAKRQRDSTVVRQQRLMASAREKATNPGAMTRAMMWDTAPVDEAAIRAEVCKEASVQAEFTLALIRDRRVVAEALTPTQREMLPVVEANARMRELQKAQKP